MDGGEYNNDLHAKIKKRKNDLVVLNIYVVSLGKN